MKLIRSTYLATTCLGVMMLMFMVSAGCSDRKDLSGGASDSTLVPDSEGRGLRIQLYDQGRMTAEILSDVMVKFEAIDSTMARVVNIDAYDSLGHITGHLVGDSAVVREKTGFMDVFGHVVFVSEAGVKLETEYLHWNPETEEIETDAFVRITRDRDWATGYGLHADQNMRRWRILKDPQGTFYGLPPGTDL